MNIISGHFGGYKHSFAGIIARLAIFLAMMAMMRTAAEQVKTLSGGQGVLDLCLFPAPSYTASVLASMNGKAAWFYRWGFFSVDMVYVLSYCTFYRCAIRYFLQKTPLPGDIVQEACLLPVIGGTADLLENTVLFMMLGSGTAPLGMCAVFTVFNSVKFLFVYASLITVIGGAVYAVKQKLKGM